MSVAVVGITDHPADYAAGPRTPGVAHAPLSEGVPIWLKRQIGELAEHHDAVLVTPHWGPNMTQTPLPYVRQAARDLVDAGATLIAGHSAHVFHGVNGRVLYDLGDLIDDYAVDERLRNDLSLLFLATITKSREVTVKAIPLRLEYAHTRQANEEEQVWIKNRLRAACTDFPTEVTERNNILTFTQTADPRDTMTGNEKT